MAGLSDSQRARVALSLGRDIAAVVPAARPVPAATRADRAAGPPNQPGEVVKGQEAGTRPAPAVPTAAPADKRSATAPGTTPGTAPASDTVAPAAFDPFSPNVIVVLRTRGRAAALAALEAIPDAASLRVLAREQQLGITGDLTTASAIRHAIVAAAERRIANRRAAAS